MTSACGARRRLPGAGLSLAAAAEVPGAHHHLLVSDPVGFVAALEGWLVKQ